MDKDKVYENICDLINGDFFLNKYTELTEHISLDSSNNESTKKHLENVAANIFNAILIGCQLFDDKERITEFVDMFSNSIIPDFLERVLPGFGIDVDVALERLKHGFGIHFTTLRICQEIEEKGVLVGYGKNAMFTEEEDKIIEQASLIQKKNDSTAEEKLNYLYKGWGAGVSSYGSLTNGFWMYHTPESLSFLFGNISNRNKEEAMEHVARCISALDDDRKEKTFDVMSNLYDRLIGEEQEVGCVLIDRDSLKYDIDYYYSSGEAVPVERRPYSKGFNDLTLNDCKITNDIDARNLRFLRVPTVIELEARKQESLHSDIRK